MKDVLLATFLFLAILMIGSFLGWFLIELIRGSFDDDWVDQLGGE